RTSRATACYVSREFVNVRNDHGLARRECAAANALIKIDSRAGQRPLERPENKLILLFQIEADPKEFKSLLQHCGNVGKICDCVGFPGHQRLDLRHYFIVEGPSIRIPRK